MIYFICPDINFPSGGTKFIYNFVELLNKNGIGASVWHKNNKGDKWDGKLSWIKYNPELVPIVYSYVDNKPNPLKLSASDVIVIPEGFGKDIIYKFGSPNIKAKKVVLAQSWSYIIPSFGYTQEDQAIKNWKQAGVENVIVISDFVKRVVKTLFKYDDEHIFKVTPFVDADIFTSILKIGKMSKEIQFYDKDLTIMYNPRKHGDRYQAVFTYLLHMHPELLKKWRILPVADDTIENNAEQLKRSGIFLSCSPEEGFGLPLLEAFGTNTISVGHTGLGADDFFKNGFEDTTNSIYQTAENLYKAVQIFENDDEDSWNEIIEKQKSIFELFSIKQTEEDLVNIFKTILGNE